MSTSADLDATRETTSRYLAYLGGCIEVHALIEFFCREAAYQGLRKSDQEDIVQGALAGLIPRLAKVENPLAYLKVVIRRTARSTRQEYRGVVALGDDCAWEEARVADPFSAAHARIEASRVLAPLSPRDRQFLVLTGEGYTFAEISEALGVSIGAARARVFRLRKKLSALA